LQTYIGVAGVIYVLLAVAAVVAVDLRILLIPAACASLGFVAAGLVIFRHLRGALMIPWPALPDGAQERGVIVIESTPLPFQGYDQELVVAVRARHVLELLACSILAGLTLYVMIFSNVVGSTSDGLQIGAFEAEIICGAGLAVLLLSLRWFLERRILRKSYYTVGTQLGRDPGFLRRGITYQFFDDKHDRRGGRGPLWGRGQDNAVLVLYDPKDPDSNTSHGGFLFHRFNVALIPSRHRQTSNASSTRAD
jgi:hypothetical protein